MKRDIFGSLFDFQGRRLAKLGNPLKDMDAQWTKKHKKSYFGCTNHVSVDHQHKLMRRYAVRSANVHDSQVVDQLLDVENTGQEVWGNSAYRSQDIELNLAGRGDRSRMHQKGKRRRALSERQREVNKNPSRIRVRVEHVLAAQSSLRRKAIRSIGLKRASTEIGL